MKRNEGTGALIHNWGYDGPGWNIPGDNFSTRFKRRVYFECGSYQFGLSHDDGAKLWIDENLVLDRWGTAGNDPYQTALSQGYHWLQVDHREFGGAANISLDWSRLSGCAPPAPTLLSPSNSASLSWDSNISFSWDVSSGAAAYYVHLWNAFGIDLNSGWVPDTQWQLGRLASGSYNWTVKARNDSGDSSPSTTWSFTVRDGPPNAPYDLQATVASQSQINLAWTDDSDNESGFRVYRGGSYLVQTGTGVTTYQDLGLSCNTEYCYSVTAFNAVGESSTGDQACARTLQCDVLTSIPSPTPTATPTRTPTPTPTRILTPTPTSTPNPNSALSCPVAPAGMALDGYLTEWTGWPTLHLDKDSANYSLRTSRPAVTDLSGDIYCAWQGNDLIIAGRMSDDVLKRDSATLWNDDGFEFGLDGLGDGFNWGSQDDHQFTVVTDGAIQDLGTYAVPGATVIARSVSGGWVVELRLPASVVGMGALFEGRAVRFNVGLNDDDDGGSRDDWLVWRGDRTIDQSENFGALILSGSLTTTLTNADAHKNHSSEHHAFADAHLHADTHQHAVGRRRACQGCARDQAHQSLRRRLHGGSHRRGRREPGRLPDRHALRSGHRQRDCGIVGHVPQTAPVARPC